MAKIIVVSSVTCGRDAFAILGGSVRTDVSGEQTVSAQKITTRTTQTETSKREVKGLSAMVSLVVEKISEDIEIRLNS